MATFLLVVVSLSISSSMLLSAPRPAKAQFAVMRVLGDVLDTLNTVWDKIKEVAIPAASTAVINGVSYFLNQMAYQAAVALTSDCPGQKICWNSKSFADGFKGAWQGAIGEAVGTLGKEGGLEKLGINICDPKFDFNFKLKLSLGLMDEVKPPAPKCEFNNLISNWSSAYNSLKPGALLDKVGFQFEKGQAPISAALVAEQSINVKSTEKGEDFKAKESLSASAGGGFTGIYDPVSGRMKSPPVAVKGEFERADSDAKSKGMESGMQATSGSIASNKILGVVLGAAGMFANTLLTRLWNKAVKGLLSTQELVNAQPDFAIDVMTREDAVIQSPGESGSAKVMQSRFATPRPKEGGVVDPLSDFAVCPSAGRTMNNCVMDMQFSLAVRMGDVTPLSVREAIDKGMLHGDWRVVSATDKTKNQDPNCYADAYCESNLKKLRAMRVIPIGWEIAASLSKPPNEDTLNTVISQFDTVGAKYYHLIDPDWVLKAPPVMCKSVVIGPQLVDPGTPNRAEYCADRPSCLKQDDRGTCVGGWGYCTRERNVWRFNADSCPAQFNTCHALVNKATSEQVNYLMNTVDYGICASDNVGCQALSLRPGADPNAAPGDTWLATPERYLNRQAEACDAKDDGCTSLVVLKDGESLNLVRNGSFEDLEDLNGDNVVARAKYWFPAVERNGASTVGVDQAWGGVAKDAKYAADGTTAMRLHADGLAAHRVSQDMIRVRSEKTYHLAVNFATSGTGISAKTTLEFRDGADNVVSATASDSYTAGDLNSSDCAIANGRVVLTTSQAGQKAVRDGCTFMVRNADIRHATLYIVGTAASSEPLFADAVQLEEGKGTPFHEKYGTASAVVYAKVPPDYLGCRGEDGDPAACFKYSAPCRENEVGCSLYTPTNGDQAIPAVLAPTDRCPAECVGYDVFKQDASDFDQEKFPIYFIPTAALACSAAEVGCSEFTDVSTEQMLYFTSLRRCQNSSEPDSVTYYTWEGSETTGYELKVWTLKSTAGTVPDQSGSLLGADSCSTPGCADAGRAPCTALKPDGSCDDNPAAPNDPDVGKCSNYSIATGDFDCREFYDKDGNRHYRYLSKTILATADCRELRITQSTQTDCARTGGFWNSTRLSCSYRASPPDSEMCASGHNGCRSYKGNAAGNVETVLADDFEKAPTAWSGTNNVDRAQSTESVVVGGHSLKIFGGKTVATDVSSNVGAGKSYTLSFWARGNGNLNVRFLPGTASPAPAGQKVPLPFSADALPKKCGNATTLGGLCPNGNGDCTAGNVCEIVGTCSNNSAAQCTRDGQCGVGNRCEKWPQVTLTSTWKRYELGPIFVASPLWTVNSVTLSFTNPGTDAFMDNLSLKQVQDSIYVVRDSWVTPRSCDQKSDGTPSPLEMLGCRAYKDVAGKEIDLRNFSQLCRQRAVGCAAYSATQNTPANPYEESFNAVCRLSAPCPNSLTSAACVCDYKINDRSAGGTYSLKDVCRVRPGEMECRFKYDGWDVSEPDGRCGNNMAKACSQDADCGPVYPVNWNSGEPNNGLGGPVEDCGMMYPATGIWNDAGCGASMVGVCDDLTLTAAGTWQQAQAECVSRGSSLVIIDSMDKNNLARLKCAQSGGNCWLGVSDIANEGQWIWVNGVSLGVAVNKCVTDSRCSNDATMGCTIDADCGSGNQCLPSAPDRVRVEADERLYLAIQPENKCLQTALTCKKMAAPHTAYEASCAHTNDTCNTTTGKCVGNTSKSCVVDSQCGQQAACEMGIKCVVGSPNNTCNAQSGSKAGIVCNSDDDCMVPGAGCKCTDAVTRNFCVVRQHSSTCILPMGSGVVDRWDPKSLKDDPAKYGQMLCSTKAVGCNEYVSSDGTTYFKEPGAKVCEYRENVTLNGMSVFGWFRKSDSGGVVPCAPGYSKNDVDNQIPKNGDVSCTLPSVCTRNRGCSCPNDVTPICSVPLGNLGCGYQGWAGKCDIQYDRCEEFLDPQDMSRSNPNGIAYYYIDNEKVDKVSCAGSVSLKQGCVLFNQTSKVNKFWSGYASYQNEKLFAKSNQRVAPVDCSKPNRDATCAKRCYTVASGSCSDGTQCNTDGDCVASANGTCSDGITPCTSDAQCGGAVGSCSKCKGEWTLGTACSSDGDCGGKHCDQTGKDCSHGETCPAGERCVGWACGAKQTGLVVANDSNVVLKVRRDRECAAWYQCLNSAPQFDDNKQKWVPVCTNFGLCSKATQNGQALSCQNWVRESPLDGWLTAVKYMNRDVSYSGLDYSGYSVPGTFSGQMIRSVMDNNELKVAVTINKGCSNDSDCWDLPCLPNSDLSSCVSSAPVKSPGHCAKAAGQATGQCAYNVIGGRAWVGSSDTNNYWKSLLQCRAYPAADAPFGSLINTDGKFYKAGSTPSKLVRNQSRRADYKGANVCDPVGGFIAAGETSGINPCECSFRRLEYGKSGTFVLYRPITDTSTPFEAVCSGGTNEGADCTAYSNAPYTNGQKTMANPCGGLDSGGICAELTGVTSAIGWQGACLEYDEATPVNGSQNLNERYACLQWLPIDQVSGAPDPYNQHAEAGFNMAANTGGANQLLYCTATNNPPATEIALHTDPTKYNKWCCWDNSCDGGYCSCASGFDTDTNNWFFGDADREDRNPSYAAQGIRKSMLKDVEVNMTFYKRDGDHNKDGTCSTTARFFLRPDDGFARMFRYDDVADECNTVNALGGDWNGSSKAANPSSANVREINLHDADPWSECAAAEDGQNGHEFYHPGCVHVEALWNDDGDPRGPLLVGFHYHTQINSQKNADDGWWQWNERKGDCGASEDHHNGHPVSEIGNIGPGGRAGVVAHLREQCMNFAFAGAGGGDTAPVVRTDIFMNQRDVVAAGKAPVTAHFSESLSAPFTMSLAPYAQASSSGLPLMPAGQGGSVPPYVSFQDDIGGVSNAPAMVWQVYGGLTNNAVMGQDSLNNYVDTPTAGGIHTASGAIFVLDGATNSLFSQMFARIYAQYAWDGPSRTYKFKSGLIDHRWDQPFTGYANRPQVRGALYSASLSCKSEGLCQEDTSESITVNGSTSTVTGQNGLYLATITYYAFADKDHMPLTGMQFDPGNGTGILMTGKPFPTPVLFKNQRGTNSSNVNICGSSADWGLTTDSCSPRYFVQSVTYSCSPDDLGILPSCAASPKKYPCQQGGACRFKPRVWFIDNWEICTGTCNGTFCRGADCTFLSESDDRNKTGASDKKPWIDFPGEIVVTP